MDQRIEAAEAQEAREQRGRGRAVHVVVAEDRDALATCGRIGDAVRRDRHIGDDVRVGHQALEGRVEEGLHVLDLDAAAGDDAREKLGDAVALRNRQRALRAALVQPVAPGAAGRVSTPRK